MFNCRICENLAEIEGSIVLCQHRKGVVHLDCCVSKCSIDNKPCEHALLK